MSAIIGTFTCEIIFFRDLVDSLSGHDTLTKSAPAVSRLLICFIAAWSFADHRIAPLKSLYFTLVLTRFWNFLGVEASFRAPITAS